jgi:hypothetical protein
VPQMLGINIRSCGTCQRVDYLMLSKLGKTESAMLGNGMSFHQLRGTDG